jgi:enoyl-CoA hydratase/carnithine racemase
MSKFLRIEKEGPLVILTMSQPEMRNVLTGNTAIEEFVDACAMIEADPSVKAVILTGEGPIFSAGGNINDMNRQLEGLKNGDITPAAIAEEYRNGIQRIPLALHNLNVPTIAAVNGGAIGAGCDLACMCDIRICTDKAFFAESFIKVGLIPGDGGAWFLPRVVGMSRAAEMALTGDRVPADQALAYGLVSRVVAEDKLMETARELAGRITVNPGVTLRLTKRLLRDSGHARLDTLLEQSANYQAMAHFTPQHEEAVTAFIEKRKPVFTDD